MRRATAVSVGSVGRRLWRIRNGWLTVTITLFAMRRGLCKSASLTIIASTHAASTTVDGGGCDVPARRPSVDRRRCPGLSWALVARPRCQGGVIVQVRDRPVERNHRRTCAAGRSVRGRRCDALVLMPAIPHVGRCGLISRAVPSPALPSVRAASPCPHEGWLAPRRAPSRTARGRAAPRSRRSSRARPPPLSGARRRP